LSDPRDFYPLNYRVHRVTRMARVLWVIILMAVAESVWALLAAETGLPLLVFYGVVVAASIVFWVPGIALEGEAPAQAKS